MARTQIDAHRTIFPYEHRPRPFVFPDDYGMGLILSLKNLAAGPWTTDVALSADIRDVRIEGQSINQSVFFHRGPNSDNYTVHLLMYKVADDRIPAFDQAGPFQVEADVRVWAHPPTLPSQVIAEKTVTLTCQTDDPPLPPAWQGWKPVRSQVNDTQAAPGAPSP